MFDDAQQELKNILALVAACPESLQEKCFEILLNAYVSSLTPSHRKKAAAAEPIAKEDNGTDDENGAVIPDAIKTRFNALVARTKVSPSKAAEIFDFNVDPFTFHGLAVPGSSGRLKMQNVALLLAIKGYLTSATWVADWKEFRATCMDHNCWDSSNSAKYMNHEWFKTVDRSSNITLGPSGQKAADALFAQLAGGAEASA